MRKINFITAIAIAAALLLSACNKTESGDTDVNNDQNQTEVEVVPDYTYDESTKTYTVYTAAGLLAWNTAAQDTLDLNCTLARDIDLTEVDWENTPWSQVGTDTNTYTGTFEGGGHTITGLTINQSETNYIGLIGYLGSGGKVQNLTLDNVDITGYLYVGGVVGQNNGTVTACSVSGSLTGQYAGGIAGRNASDGTITACYFKGNVTSTGNDHFAGGITGMNMNGGQITACYSIGEVTGTYDGGIAGRNTSGSTITACFWIGDYNVAGGGGSGTDSHSYKVGSDDCETWIVAQEAMNSALENAQSEWRYTGAGDTANADDAPTLTKSSSE